MTNGIRAAIAVTVMACLPFATTMAAPADAALAKAIDGEARTSAQKARDGARHPAESLSFWGLAPRMSILEVQPGGSAYWTEILAPYAKATGGKFAVTGPDVANAPDPAGATKSLATLKASLDANKTQFGPVDVVPWGTKSAPLAANQYDFILTARSVHGWMMGKMETKVFADLFRALKPGGILALEQHRANAGPQDPGAKTGYVTEAHVIDLAKQAGFELAGRSDINANAKDTKDHPFGVWTLPPTRTAKAPGSDTPADPNFAHAKYDAIGESDRMTLKFVKPKG